MDVFRLREEVVDDYASHSQSVVDRSNPDAQALLKGIGPSASPLAGPGTFVEDGLDRLPRRGRRA